MTNLVASTVAIRFRASPVSTTQYTLFNSDPTTPWFNDDPVTLGLEFVPRANGRITAIRFWKDANNSGTHIGSMWTGFGDHIRSQAFVGETSSGWQQVNFDAPVDVTADTSYVASFHTTTGYSANGAHWENPDSNTDIGPISVTNQFWSTYSGNGLFEYGPTPTFPDRTFNMTNYWVDFIFEVDTDVPDDTLIDGASSGTSDIEGASNLDFAASGAMTGIGTMTGTSSKVFSTSSILLGPGSMAASSSIALSVQAAIVASAVLSGSASTTTSAQATAIGSTSLEGSSTISLSVEADGSIEVSIGGSLDLNISSDGSLVGSGSISGTSSLTMTAAIAPGEFAVSIAGSASFAVTSTSTLEGAGALEAASDLSIATAGGAINIGPSFISASSTAITFAAIMGSTTELFGSSSLVFASTAGLSSRIQSLAADLRGSQIRPRVGTGLANVRATNKRRIAPL